MRIVLDIEDGDEPHVRRALAMAGASFERAARDHPGGARKKFWRARALRFGGYALQVKHQHHDAKPKGA